MPQTAGILRIPKAGPMNKRISTQGGFYITLVRKNGACFLRFEDDGSLEDQPKMIDAAINTKTAKDLQNEYGIKPLIE